MPRHDPNKPSRTDRERSRAFRSAMHRARENVEACEDAFDRALEAVSDMLGHVAKPEDAMIQLEARDELRKLARRIQRRLDPM